MVCKPSLFWKNLITVTPLIRASIIIRPPYSMYIYILYILHIYISPVYHHFSWLNQPCLMVKHYPTTRVHACFLFTGITQGIRTWKNGGFNWHFMAYERDSDSQWDILLQYGNYMGYVDGKQQREGYSSTKWDSFLQSRGGHMHKRWGHISGSNKNIWVQPWSIENGEDPENQWSYLCCCSTP